MLHVHINTSLKLLSTANLKTFSSLELYYTENITTINVVVVYFWLRPIVPKYVNSLLHIVLT